MEIQARGRAAQALAVVVQPLQHTINPADGDRDTPNPVLFIASVAAASQRVEILLLCCSPWEGSTRPLVLGWGFSGREIGHCYGGIWAALSDRAKPLNLRKP